MLLKDLSILALVANFVQPSGTILVYLVEGHPRIVSVKFFEKWSDIILRFSWF